MSDEPDEAPSGPRPSGRSRYEDFELEVPTAQAAPRRRTPLVTVAAVVLGFSGVLPILSVLAFSPSGATAAGLLALGVIELIGAVFVAMLWPLGRPLGIVLGCVGLVIGFVTALHSPANGLVTMGLNGYVIYALTASGPAFGRG
jgi:hypothetical protein